MRVRFLSLGFENNIHKTEIGHAALVRIRAKARMRSPSIPAANHTDFRVIASQTVNVNKVEPTILASFPEKEDPA